MMFAVVFCNRATRICETGTWRVTNRIIIIIIIRSTSPSQPNEMGLKCLSVPRYVCMSVRLQKVSSIINEIWCVHRGRRVMHDGMQYDPIQGQGHGPLKVGNLTKGYLLPHL